MITQAVLNSIQPTFESLTFPARPIVCPNVPDAISASRELAFCQSFAQV